MKTSSALVVFSLLASVGCGGGNASVADGGALDGGTDADCSTGACATDMEIEQAALVHQYADGLKAGTASTATIDWDTLADNAALTVLTGDGTSRTLFHAMRAIQQGVPEGHQELLYPSCGEAGAVPYDESTWYGVCGRPHGNAVVVTYARAGNALGLNPGDQVLATDRFTAGDTFFAQIAAEPVCGSSMPAKSSQTESAAASLFGLIDVGSVLTVQAPDGTMRTVTAPARDSATEWCISPFGGNDDFESKVTMRPDGVAVIRIPGFLSSAYPLPSPLTTASYQQWISDYVARMQTTLASVSSAPGIVWDARSNTGGSVEVALAIVAGMTGAKAGVVSQGFERLPDTSPFQFETTPEPTYSFSMTVGGPLAYGGKVAVLIDGLTYSAGDFFAYAVHHFSSAILVGRPNAGAFGYGGRAAVDLGTPPEFAYTVDIMKSVDANGLPLEGTQIVPDIAIEYDPADLAAGKDTVLEAAVAAVLAP